MIVVTQTFLRARSTSLDMHRVPVLDGCKSTVPSGRFSIGASPLARTLKIGSTGGFVSMSVHEFSLQESLKHSSLQK